MPEKPAPTTTVEDERNDLVSEYLDLLGSIKEREVLLAQVATRLLAEFGEGGRWELKPGVGIRVQAPAAVFNGDKAKAVLTADQYAAICEPKPSVRLAVMLLPGVLVDQCKVTGKPSVRAL